MAARFSGRTILITGGNSGIGLGTAQRIVHEGGRVIITGRDATTLKKACEQLGADKAEAIQVDVSRLSDIDRLAEIVRSKYGTIDGLFANAGVAVFQPIELTTEKDFDFQFDVNVKGVFFTLQKIVPLLKPGSAVLLTSSVAGSIGSAVSAVYGATKAAVRSMGRTFSGAYVSKGLRFNVLSPGPIETPIWDRPGGLSPEAVETIKKTLTEANPMKRYGTVEEAAAAAAFLLSSESSYIIGVELFVDGGVTQL
jgi:NAD(P)-dependent dehydrogenase (short-subunit alcohol dehydrogenase family)